MDTPTTALTLDLEGLTDKCRPALVRFGRRNTGMVINVPSIKVAVDPASGLTLFPLDDVFVEPPVCIGFGTPNTYLVIPDAVKNSTHKLAGFMFWRQKSAVVPTKGRVQAGVLFELRGLSSPQLDALRREMSHFSDKRSASCARLTCQVLAAAGFTLGNGRSLALIYRPSKFASLLWRYGLSYHDEDGVHPVNLRVIHATPRPFGDHFVGVWMREIDSPIRAVRKMFTKHQNQRAPVFEEQNLPKLDTTRWSGPELTVGMARSNRIGANFAFAIGQKPSYVVRFPEELAVPELSTSLKPFPIVKDFVTRMKRDILFSRPVIGLVNKIRLADMDWYVGGIKSDMAIDMIMPSLSPDYSEAMLYNCVVTKSEVRLTGLHTREARNQKSKLIRTIDWVAAKHVLISDYDPHVVYACEMWAYRDESERPVLCINNNSGTYKPTAEQMEAFASYLRRTFDVQVSTFPM
ncbi:MAG: hypothetical protein ABIP74_04625 [Candidatus Saccharimonas sp.]